MKAIQIVHHKSKRIYGIMKYKKDEICYIIENNIKIVPVKILKYSSEFYTVKLLSKAGAIRLKEHRIFATEEEARKILGIDRVNIKLAYVKTDISQNLKVYREGRRVTVQGLVLINGTSTTFELPYTATDVTRFPTIGLSNSLALAGYSFGTIQGAACKITFGNAITYAAVNFAYYTNL